MSEAAQPRASKLRSLTLLVGFAAYMAALPLLAISLSAFVVVAAVLLAVANIAFLREFGIRRFTAAATLIAFNLLVATVTTLILLAVIAPENSASDYLLSAIPVLAIAFAVMQAFFVRDHW
jgi:hypothetical protein